jgi:hypothetical protein
VQEDGLFFQIKMKGWIDDGRVGCGNGESFLGMLDE